MKTALQLTMHYVRNYGSALQTYALQKAIESVPGWRCETLDIRPHWEDGGWSMVVPESQSTGSVAVTTAGSRRSLFDRLRAWRLQSLVRKIGSSYRSYRFIQPWERMFDDFLKTEIHCTPRIYCNVAELREDPPKADVYITGSDQTFNPRFTRGEDFWFWSFLSDQRSRMPRKISYAASFACSHLRDDCHELYKRWLSTYRAVSVRESSGVGIACELGVEATHCCDPTLLLNRQQWQQFSSKATRKVRNPYILCYNLRYAVDPYPMAEALEREVSKKLGLPVIHLQEGPMQWNSSTGRILRGVSIYDFVDLFLNASFVMTSSFHGTAFALQSGIPFLTYVNADSRADSRALDLLRKCNGERHAVNVTGKVPSCDIECFDSNIDEQQALLEFRTESLAWLIRSLG